MQTCIDCHEAKPLSQFNKNKTKHDGYQKHCRECDNFRRRQWYKKHDNKKRVIANVRKHKQLIRAAIFKIKKDHGCSKCKQNHPAALDFHHRDPTLKTARISTMIVAGMSLIKIKQEIEKCILLCANCHRILHYEEKHGPVAQ